MPAIITRGYHPAHDVANKKGSVIGKFDGSDEDAVAHVFDWLFYDEKSPFLNELFVLVALRAIDLNNLIQIIWICMLHKRSGESARSRIPVFSRHILESVKPRRAIFYLSSLKYRYIQWVASLITVMNVV